MGARRSTPSSARERYYKRRMRRTGVILAAALVLALVIGGALAYPALAPGADLALPAAKTQTPAASIPAETLALVTEAAATPEPEPTPIAALPTQGQLVPPSDDPQILYYATAGDSLPVVSAHFGVEMDDITSPATLDREGFLPPGQLLIIPNELDVTSSSSKLLPDSEVTFSPSTVDFDIETFITEAGGYLASYKDDRHSVVVMTGAQIIKRIALEYSINPRLILAFLEYESGWVYGQPATENAALYPLGYIQSNEEGLYAQAAWFASNVMDGYYGWWEGRTLVVQFEDGEVIRLAPDLNSGTVGLMHAFAALYRYDNWSQVLYGENNFFDFYETMFGSPWIRAQAVEPLIPVDTEQPEMILPFEIGRLWAFTGGPHAAWSLADIRAALDFAPGSAESGCVESTAWAVAAIPGLITRSENGVVVIDMDGDGYEQTGWTLLYLHVATKDRIAVGTWVDVGDRIGHPSCEGGRATGTHLHIARRYNGEWIPADGPLPFVLSGWEAKAGQQAYEGWLLRGEEVIYASTASTYISQITREQ